MNAALLAACDSLDRALAAAVGVVEPGQLERLARLAGEVRVRADLLGNTMVVALAGGTGSGKSSIFNALAREELVPTGPLRPTTSVPAALIPANPEPGLVRWLDRIGIDLRFGQAHLGELAVIECAGAYGFVMGSNYNSRPLAAEVLVRDGRAQLIRRRQTFDDLVRGEEIPQQ